MQFSYNPYKTNILNLGYRYASEPVPKPERENITQYETDFSFYWQIAPMVNMIGKRTYSITEKLNKELLFGVEYDSCCWAFRIVKRSFFTHYDISEITREQHARFNNSLWFQIEFKGFTSVGRNLPSLLGHSQYGIEGF